MTSFWEVSEGMFRSQRVGVDGQRSVGGDAQEPARDVGGDHLSLLTKNLTMSAVLRAVTAGLLTLLFLQPRPLHAVRA